MINQSSDNHDQTATIALGSQAEDHGVRIENLHVIEGEVLEHIFNSNHNVSQHSAVEVGNDQQSMQMHHSEQTLIPVATAIPVDEFVTQQTKLWVVSIGKNTHKNFTEVAVKRNVWSHVNLQDRNEIRKDDFVLFAVRLFRPGASQGFNRSQTECYGTLKQLMLVRVTAVGDNFKDLDVYKASTNTWHKFPFGYSFQIEWMENNAEFTLEKYGKQILEARRRSDIGGGIVIRADVEQVALVNLRHKKELENMHNPQHMVDLSSQSSLGKRSASLMENDAAGEAMLTPTLVDYVNSPDKKRQKKLRPDIDITEPVQLPVRLRLVNKGIEYWCTLEMVDADQEVKSILLESADGSGPPSRFPNLSAAAKHVTGLETANGWKKWYYNYKGKWLPIGIFRRPGATPRLSHEFKDVRIKPRGKGFVNQGQVSSSPLPDGYQPHSSMEDPSLSALLTATQTAGYPNENYVSSKTVMEEQLQVIKCILSFGDKKKMLFLPYDKFVGDLIHTIRDDFGDGIAIVLDGYEVDPSTKLVHIAQDDGTATGRYIVKADVKMKTHQSHHHHTSLSNLTQAMQEMSQTTRDLQNLPLSQAI